ncbi:hypothetical protein Hypma_012365 [Hypsizygus marmoreus]|uniref:Uncharacterized protein n=1 Tax=Hypsizygus marmoreus TaxID=39966 RepID=A0A369KBY3_HYPMA|nr:hypothetical protein Hypma_012365 [Hypsizygus marmoreus]
MPSFRFSIALLAALLLQCTVKAALNDWAKPCFQGECFYDLPATNIEASGSLKIWGSPDAISDITAAAGWTILGCSPNALAQDIRLVCNSDDTNGAGCDHLYQNIGAQGKIVRLPENCGKNAFARVAKAWIPEDQSIPINIARRLSRRQGAVPEVKALSLDTDFAAIDPAQTGDISIAIQGSTVPGENGNLTVTPPSRRRSIHSQGRRGFLSFIEDAFNKFNSFDESVTKNLPPVDFSKNFPILSQSISCPGPPAVDSSINADVTATSHAVISLGVAAAGTIVPPKLTDFGLFVGMDATLQGTLALKGNVAGKADSGQLTLFQVGIPGLDFPGILSVGPTFKILGQATATLDVNVNMNIDLSYTVNRAKLFFPPSPNSPSDGSFSPGNRPLKLSVSPSLASKAIVTAHLIPRLDIGVSALGGVAEATVFLDLDTSASVTMTLNAAANAGASVETSTGDVTSGASGGIDGCVKAGAALNVNAGAEGSFFGIFDKSTQVPLFGKEFEVFQKCFGSQKRDGIASRSRHGRREQGSKSRHPQLLYHRRALQLACPAPLASTNLVAVA